MNKKTRIPSLPRLLKSKIYKTGQTRGADDDVIFQNRVNRNSTVLIPYRFFDQCKIAPYNNGIFENGYIVLINPVDYFELPNFKEILIQQRLQLGINALLFYYSREQWNNFNPIKNGLTFANSRTNPLGGQYVARVPSTTSDVDTKIQHGFNVSTLKGAGIRVYEYANKDTIDLSQLQLEYIFWQCYDAKDVLLHEGMLDIEVQERQEHIEKESTRFKLNDKTQLISFRILNSAGRAICPLCLAEISAFGFFKKVEQAEGREISDLTVTQLNLFHIQELRTGQYNHRPYNLGWGHHHCNIVVKDSGINDTLIWMNQVIEKNKMNGFVFN